MAMNWFKKKAYEQGQPGVPALTKDEVLRMARRLQAIQNLALMTTADLAAEIAIHSRHLPEVKDGERNFLVPEDYTAEFVGMLRAIVLCARGISLKFGSGCNIGAILGATFPQLLEDAAQLDLAQIDAARKAWRAQTP
jgi:hypothetical protein